jgi:hypothetical protein
MSLGGVLAFIAANLIVNAEVKAMQTTVDGWSTTLHHLELADDEDK